MLKEHEMLSNNRQYYFQSSNLFWHIWSSGHALVRVGNGQVLA